MVFLVGESIEKMDFKGMNMMMIIVNRVGP